MRNTERRDKRRMDRINPRQDVVIEIGILTGEVDK